MTRKTLERALSALGMAVLAGLLASTVVALAGGSHLLWAAAAAALVTAALMLSGRTERAAWGRALLACAAVCLLAPLALGVSWADLQGTAGLVRVLVGGTVLALGLLFCAGAWYCLRPLPRSRPPRARPPGSP